MAPSVARRTLLVLLEKMAPYLAEHLSQAATAGNDGGFDPFANRPHFARETPQEDASPASRSPGRDARSSFVIYCMSSPASCLHMRSTFTGLEQLGSDSMLPQETEHLIVTSGTFSSSQHSLSNLQSSVFVAEQVEMDHGTGWERGRLPRGAKQSQLHPSGALPGPCWPAMHLLPCACTWPCSISMACTTTGPSEPQVCPSSSSGQS